ncbi:leucine-rich repeat and IQ domain-containing protein 1 [Notolabrus celidotus]|uniref:leucine-rich repeat and IQ domain-containing protein 1 n=1 Tax=Notolabrus celidotus TaxID=1203425 RepID=UPI0014900FD6|nr:leucine-rich repeat and IQ domain-containing protein 1 [Notolabrus celidotus]
MTHVNDIYDAIMRELNNTVICDTDETTGRLESSSFHEEMDEDEIPSSLLSYFERSKSRAAVCEKLILEEPEDFFASHHTEDMMNVPNRLDEDMMKLNEQVVCDPVTTENNTSTDNRLLHAPTDPEDLLTHSVSVCPNNEAGTDESEESEKQYVSGVRLLEISLDEEENLRSSGYEAEREKLRHEEVKEEEHRRQIEDDFQKELKSIMEAEKLRQRELELMEKKAQEKLDQELLLQQEVISSLQRRVEEERRRMEEEQKRLKDEEDKRKREEDRMKKETERKRMEEVERRKKDEERNIQEMKLKEEEERKRVEEEKRRMEREEKRMREEKRLLDLEKKKREDETRMMKKKEERKKKEEEKKFEEEARRRVEEEQKRLKDEEDKRKREKERMKKEEVERRKKDEERKIQEIKLKEEEERKKMEDEKRMREDKRLLDLEKKKLDDEMRMMKKEEERKRKEEEKKFKEEEVGTRDEERKKIEEVRRMERERRKKEQEMMKEEEDRNKTEEEKLRSEEGRRKMKENEERRERQKREEVERIRKEERNERENVEEAGKTSETEEKKSEDEMILKMKEEMGRKTSIQGKMNKDTGKWNTGENGNQKEEVKVGDQKQREEERKDREEKRKEEQRTIREDKGRGNDDASRANEGEGTARHRDQEDYKKSEDGKRLTEDKEGFKGYDGDKREVESESKTKDKERKKEEEGGKLEERERENVEAEEKQVGRKKIEKDIQASTDRGEGMRPAEKKEINKRMVQGVEDEVKKVGESELQMKRMKSEYEDVTEGSIWTSSSPGPPNMKSVITSSPRHDPDKTSTQTSTYNTVDCENQEERPSSVSDSLPAYLPEHTEQKRLSWMKECVPWSKLSLQNRRKQKASHRGGRGTRRAVEAGSLTPLCSDFLLQSTGWKSLKEVTTVTLEDLPGCSLSTLSQCAQLQSLTLRRCGLRSLEGVNQLSQLCYIDLQENKISFIDCENLMSLRVLKLGHNKLTSIHGLTGAENVEVLELSHNSITRIAGLESMKRLQKLSLDHNQLISTKGLKDVYTLLHLNCSHNHLVRVEGVENSALLNTLDLRGNSLTEPPSLNNQVLLRELHLDDNSISSLQGLADCWVPLLQHLSVAQNRITQLPSMSDAVSLANLDLRFNCLSELQNVSENLEGCQFLRELHLTGNPLQQESGWRSTLQKALPGLRSIDDQETDSFLSPPAVQQLSLASGSFLALCQAQLQQTHDVQQQHSRELSEAPSPLDAVKLSCRHFAEALQLAVDQRFAHEYGDTSVADIPKAAGQTTDKKTLNVAGTKAEERTEEREIKCTRNVPPVVQSRDNIRRSDWTSGEKSAAESQHRTFSGPTASRANSDSINTSATKEKTSSLHLEVASVSNQHDLNLQNKAAVMIQQLWRKYKQKCGNIRRPSTAEKGGGDGGKPEESGPALINRSVQDYAATVIQAVWRGFTLRRRLASALAAVTCSDTGEDDTFEEVDVDEFVFDEAALEEHWTPLWEDPPSRSYTVSEQQLTLKLPEPSQHALPSQPVWRSKQAWVDEEQEDCGGQRVSPVSSVRMKPLASTPVPRGLTERSEKILEEWGFTHSHTALMMLKRAQKMKSKKQQQRKRSDPSALQFSFRNCSYQMDPAGAQNRRAKNKRCDIQVGEVELGLQLAEKMERVKQERAQQWLHTQAALADRDSESVRFLPEISAGILNGGRVQLVADPGYTERQHHASGLLANNSLAARPCKENSYPRSNSLGHARLEVPSPKRDSSAPSKKERISYRDNPVQLSGGWGGGKKRDRVHK